MRESYPVRFSVERPEEKLGRISTLLRPLFVLPALILITLLQEPRVPLDPVEILNSTAASLGGIGLVALPTALMLVVRRKYPKWWFEWNRELLRYINRIAVYMSLITDRYPSTDEQQVVELEMPYPTNASLSRILPLVKWLLATPHYFALAVLFLFLPVNLLIAWLAILTTGRYPGFAFDYVEGVLRWTNRVTAYAFTMVTDRYPPFSLAP